MSVAETLMEAASRFLFRVATVTDVVDLAPGFRRIHLEGADLKSARFDAGDKLQVYLPGAGMRTYSPIHWDAERGSTTLLGAMHGDSPGSRWVRRAAVGDVYRVFGPRRSIPVASLGPRVVVLGDETSFALARAARIELGAEAVFPVLEVGSIGDAQSLLEDLGLAGATLVARLPDDAHLPALAEALGCTLDAHLDAALVMTGRARTIQEMRARLGSKVKARAGKTKAYWSLGRAGLD